MDDRHKVYKTNFDKDADIKDLPAYCLFVPENALFLDVGCACGDTGALLKHIKNTTNYGLEYNQESLDMALETKAYEEAYQIDLDLLRISQFSQFIRKFDVVFAGDVLEHLRNPTHVLSQLKHYLNQDGFLLLSLPNVAHMSVKAALLANNLPYMPSGLLDETHIHFFTYKSIMQMLNDAKLEILGRNFTFGDSKAGLEYDPYEHLDKELIKYIASDWHSYVAQYIIAARVSTKSPEELAKHNELFFHFTNLPSGHLAFKIKTKTLQELGLDQ